MTLTTYDVDTTWFQEAVWPRQSLGGALPLMLIEPGWLYDDGECSDGVHDDVEYYTSINGGPMNKLRCCSRCGRKDFVS